jgi:para-aminobenzoate synthetase component 1
MTPFIFELEDLDPLDAFNAIADLPYSLFLDSADPKHPSSRYSFVMCKPVEMISHKNGKTTITSKTQRGTFTGEIFDVLAERMKTRMNAKTGRVQTIEGLPPFQGGLAGYFGYDLGRGIEDLPEIAADNPDMPDLCVGIYDQVYAYDHHQDRGWVITHSDNESEARIKQKCFVRALTKKTNPRDFDELTLDWKANFDAHDYKEQVRTIQDYITEGDIFQANMTQRFDVTLPADFDPAAHYMNLRTVNAAPFACYMNTGDIQISSASPERFLTVDSNRTVTTQPIKGTRPHVEDKTMDRVYQHELRTSMKERAENTMIVDLMRNDLSKSCRADSITVPTLCKIETFASVHHLVSTVNGVLEDGQTPFSLLRGCFPGGSITGAPKIRAMEIIEELEPTRRGVYCGSMGYIGFDGSMDSNILIRTVVYETLPCGTKAVSFQTGGGIVADSDPDEEYGETFDKADAIFRSFEELYDAEDDDEDELYQLASA